MNKCIDCGVEIYRTSIRCRRCSNKNPETRRKNSEGTKKAYSEGRKTPNKGAYGPASKEWRLLHPKEYKKGVEKQKASFKENLSSGKFIPSFLGKHHSEEFRKKQSIRMSEWLKNSDNHKKYGRGKKSHMEEYFEGYLNKHSIQGWQGEKHFFSKELKKNFFVDFLFEDLKIIVELDGTQHRNTTKQDSIRDEWFIKQGYKVIRIPVEEFKKGKWEKELLLILKP